MLRTRLSLLAGASFLCLASAASADVVVLQDTIASAGVQKCTDGPGLDACDGGFGPSSWTGVEFQGYYDKPLAANSPAGLPAWADGTSNTNKKFRWGDVIGDPANFQLDSVTITKTATSITFTQKTKFDGEAIGAYTSHMFIDTLTPLIADSFNYAIVLGPDQDAVDSDGAGPDVAKPRLDIRPDTNPAAGDQRLASGFYAVTAVKTPADLWTSGTWGGLIQFCLDNADPGTCDATASPGTAIAPPVLATAGTKVGDVSWSRINGGDGWYYLSAVVTNVDMSLFNQFDILATVADCANDALWGPTNMEDVGVPVPGAVFLLGFGLLGLGAVRRRKAA